MKVITNNRKNGIIIKKNGMVCYISITHQAKILTFRNSPLIWTIILCCFYGATDEYHQTYTPGRTGLVTDVLIDTFGALIMILIIKYFLSKKLRLFKSPQPLTSYH